MLRLKELRIEAGKTQSELAELLGISRQVYANYENSINEPSLGTLIQCANIFQCSLDFLLCRSDDFGNVTVYQQTDALSSLSAEEQKIIGVLRKKTSKNVGELLKLYAELPPYMQESIFAELKGMYLGYAVSKNKNTSEGQV